MKKPKLVSPIVETESSERFVDEMREIYHQNRNSRLDLNAEDMLESIRSAVRKAVDDEESFVVFETDGGGFNDRDKEPIFQRVLVLLNETGLTHDLSEDLIKSETDIENITLSGWETPVEEEKPKDEAPKDPVLPSFGGPGKIALAKKPATKAPKKSAGGAPSTKKKSKAKAPPRADYTVERHGRD